jgi:hypothetical protein
MPAQLVSDALANATAATQPAEGGPTGHRALTWPAGWAHPDRTRTRGWGVLGGLAQAGACVQPVQQAGRPPGGTPIQPHRGGQQRAADERGVQQHGQRQPDPERL